MSTGHPPITMGQARFTVLTDRLIRCEWHEHEQFEDRPTLSVASRIPSPCPLQVSRDGRSLLLDTGKVQLRYHGGPFTKGSLQATWQQNGDMAHWHYGQKDRHNCGGTYRTLDGCDGGYHLHWDTEQQTHVIDRPVNVGTGLISPSGWAVHDDSHTLALDERSDKTQPWAAPRHPGLQQDLYLFTFGRDHHACLAAAAKLFGPMPLPPRYALGYWYSKYWAYTDREIETLAAEHRRLDIPADVMVIDMDWHLLGWTGYTWNRDYFPDPADCLSNLHDQHFRVTLNLHPADGVASHEEAHPTMATSLGLPTEHPIEFDCTDPGYMQEYFRQLHHPHEDIGVDFWWMDWQQGTQTRLADLDPLPWLNHLHWQDQQQRLKQRGGKRPMSFSRYGGLGSHRHPIGFSGDTWSTWRSLSYQPGFTATAANVLYGCWSHDIGGHMPGTIEPELFVRWMQFGAYSPILRTHTCKNETAERRLWQYPAPFDSLLLASVQQRYERIPYLYSEWKHGCQNGLSAIRPLYHDHPREDEAYRQRQAYCFGQQLICAPVVGPIGEDEQAKHRFWLPTGEWIDIATGERLTGGKQNRCYRLEEIPVFIRPGGILPGQFESQHDEFGGYRRLLVEAWAGGDDQYALFEDDGISIEHEHGQSAVIPLVHQEENDARLIEIGTIQGSYRGIPKRRQLEIRVHMAAPPRQVSINGTALPWSHRRHYGHWSYDGDLACTLLRLDRVTLHEPLRIRIQHQAPHPLLPGLPGLLRRLQRVMALSNQASQPQVLHPLERLPTRLAQTGNRIERDPNCFQAELDTLQQSLPQLKKALTAHKRKLKKQANQHGVNLLTRALAILPKP